MELSIKNQVSATYARNHFKEVTEKALEEGICVIVKKSKPITVILPIQKYYELQNSKVGPQKKVSLQQLRKNPLFDDLKGKYEKVFGNISPVELTRKWTDYVD